MDQPMKKPLYILALLFIAFGCSHYSLPEGDPLVAIQIQDRNGFTETISTPERLENYLSVDFLTSKPFKKILRVYKNNGKNHSIITTYHPNGSIFQYLEGKEMRASGSYREWFPNGQMKIDSHVIGGTADITQGAQKDWLFDGTSRVWDEDGHLIAQIPYLNGVLSGTSLYYYPSGITQCQIDFVKNMEEGDRIEFYPNGNVKSKNRFEKGIRTGASLGYFENNLHAWIEEYKEGLLLKGTYYSPQGEAIAEVKDGRGQQARYEGNAISFLLEIRQGVPEGVVKKFLPKGDLMAIYSIKNNKKHGEETSYYLPEPGEHEWKPKLSIQWEQGSIHGIVKTWYRNGQLQSQREYCRNVKSGPTCAWYKNGSLMFVEEYEEGTLSKGAYYKRNHNEPISTVMNGNGTSYLYNEDGAFMKKVTYAKGKPTDPEE
jgi:antitoxin component YwqK of YwqJK toxin-antitoxin module